VLTLRSRASQRATQVGLCNPSSQYQQIGSIPRPVPLIEAVAAGSISDPNVDPMYEAAVKDTIERLEATGSLIVTDGEQRKYHNFWTYSVHGLSNTARTDSRRHGGLDTPRSSCVRASPSYRARRFLRRHR
jgi:methionine synthase II (cobalamin-independent)